MASWRYFGIQSYQLSWAESATLAVLPNAPSLIYQGKSKIAQPTLLKLNQEGVIDKQTYELSIDEPLPQNRMIYHKLPSFIATCCQE
jgi:penicillin-binding protein 1C